MSYTLGYTWTAGIALPNRGDAYGFLVTGRPARSAAMPVLFLLTGPKMGFSPRRGKNVGTQAPKLSKFRILARNLYLRGDSFAIFLRNSQHLYASIGSF